MHFNSFLRAFNRLGLTQWEGIEQVIAWGHVTSLMGLARPSVDGPIFIYRAQCRLGGQSPHRVRLMATTGLGPEPLLADIASHFEDLADPVQFEPWRLIAIDTSRRDWSGALVILSDGTSGRPWLVDTVGDRYSGGR